MKQSEQQSVSMVQCSLMTRMVSLAAAAVSVARAADSISVQGSGLLAKDEPVLLAVQREVGQESSSDWVGVTDAGSTITLSSASLSWEYVVLEADNTATVSVSTTSLTGGQDYDAFYLADGGYR